ncbi:MAG: YybH family protein [Bacteroidota bacterium]
MKYIYLPAIMWLFFLFPLKAQNTEQSAILHVLLEQQRAWNSGYIYAFMQGYWNSDSLYFIGKRGITRGWQQTLDNYLKSYPDTATMGKLQFDIVSIDICRPDAAFVIGKWQLHRQSDKGNTGGHFTLWFKKINNRWVIVADHTS